MAGERDDHREEPREPGAPADGRDERRQVLDGAYRAPSVTVFPLSALRQKAAGEEARPLGPPASGAGGASNEEAPTVFPLADRHRRDAAAEHGDEDARELGAGRGSDNGEGDGTKAAGHDESARPEPQQGRNGGDATTRPAAAGVQWDGKRPPTLEEAQRSAEALIALEKTILSLLREPAPRSPVERPVFGAGGTSGERQTPREIKIFRPPAAPADSSPRPPVPGARLHPGDIEPQAHLFRGPQTPPERILPSSARTHRQMQVPFEIEPILPRLVHEIDALPEVDAPEDAEPAPWPSYPTEAAADDGTEPAARQAEAGDGSAALPAPSRPTAAPRLAPRPGRERDGESEPIRPAPMLVADNAGLAVDGIGKRFKQRQVLRGVSLTLQRGEVVGLLGPNGAGKTTCFYIITGLISADYGAILLDDKDITGLPMYRRARLGIGYLPQEPSIFRGLNVENNIRAVLESVESERDAREARLDDLLAEFSITHLRRTPALALSGGERRRVEIARALALQPNFILLDEPLAGIDPIALGDIRDLVAHLKDRGIGVLITDHNVRETLEIVDRAYIIYNGEVLMSGKPSEIVSHDDVRRVYLGDGFTL